MTDLVCLEQSASFVTCALLPPLRPAERVSAETYRVLHGANLWAQVRLSQFVQ
jgi:hypothetical protein